MVPISDWLSEFWVRKEIISFLSMRIIVRLLWSFVLEGAGPHLLQGMPPHKHNVTERTTSFHVYYHSKQEKPCFAALLLHLKPEAPQASQAVRELQEIISQSQEAGVRHASHLHRHMLQNVATFPA